MALAGHTLIVGDHFANLSLMGYGAVRYGGAALVALAWLISRGQLKSAFGGKALGYGLVAGAVGITVARALLLSVQAHVGAEATALAAPLAPLVLAVVMHLGKRMELNLWLFSALLAGFAGCLLLAGIPDDLGAFLSLPVAITFLAAIVAIGTLFGTGNPLYSVNGAIGGAALVLFFAAAASAALAPDEALEALTTVANPMDSFDQFIWFGADVLVTTLLPYALLMQAMKNLNAVAAASSLFLAPVAMALLAYVLKGQEPASLQMVGGVIAMAACAVLAAKQQ